VRSSPIRVACERGALRSAKSNVAAQLAAASFASFWVAAVDGSAAVLLTG